MTAVLSPRPLLPGLRPFRPQGIRPVPVRPVGAARPRNGLVLVPPPAERASARASAPTPATYLRRRFMALVLLGAVAVGVVALVSTAAHAGADLVRGTEAAPAAAPAVPVLPKVYVVRSGDTLWSIARRLQPEGDVRPLVEALTERGGSPVLAPGQRVDLDGLDL
jgi:Tfp pilus assembly protein FimV